MKSRLTKIHILGGPCAGKTYLSKKLSKKFKLKRYNLDDIVWNKKSDYYDIQIPKIERDKKLNQILKNKSWIIEGVYYDWVIKSFKKADLIIILKPNVFLRDFRIIRRFILKKLRLYEEGKKERFKDLFSFLKWNHYYEKERIFETLEITKFFKKKRVIFNNADEAFEYILKLRVK